MCYVSCGTIIFKLESLQDPGGIRGVELGVSSKISCYLKLFESCHLYKRFHFGKVLLTTALKSSLEKLRVLLAQVETINSKSRTDSLVALTPNSELLLLESITLFFLSQFEVENVVK